MKAKNNNKTLKALTLFILLFNSISYAQTICNPSGNLIIYSNYESGNIEINVDVNIPNLKIGICTYHATKITISGTFSNNVTGVTITGYGETTHNHCGITNLTSTVIGVPVGFVNYQATGNITYSPSHGNGYAPSIVGAGGDCDTLIYQGGGNTPDEIVYYFLQQYSGSTLRYHHIKYNCWMDEVFNVSAGGNCCILPAAPCSAPTNPANITAAANLTICAGSSTTLSASSTATVNWYASNSSTVVLATGANFNTPVLATGNYTYYAGAINGCGNSATKTPITINVNATPTITSSSANSATICSGQSYTISSLSGGIGNYTLTNTGATSATQFVVNPTASITYTVIGANASGCISTASSDFNVTVIINASPTLALSSVSNNTICSGQTVTFTPSGGASTYTLISNNSYTDTSSPYTDTPATSSDYTLTGTAANGCISSLSSQQFMTTVFVNATPIISTSGANSGTLCSGQSFTISPLAGSGTGSYTLTPDNLTSTTNFVVTPSVTTTYSIIGANANGCVSTSSSDLNIALTVNSTPTVNAVFSSNALCSSQSITITMSGANSGYTLNPGNTPIASGTGSIVITPPAGTTVYTITANNSNGCVTTLSQQIYTTSVSVVTNPTITASAITNSICAGGTASITPFGATSFTLMPGNLQVNSGQTFTLTPTVPTTYTINGTATGGCESIASTQFVTTIGINANPTVTAVSALSNTICTGLTTTLTASGATSYTWTGGPSTADYIVSPNATTVYTVIGENASGCSNSSAPLTLTVNVLSSPTLALATSINTNTLCSGNSATITLGGASAGSTYSLFPGASTNTSSFVVNPTTTTDYTVIATDNANGCVSTTSGQVYTTTVTVATSPTITLSSIAPSATLCSGQSVTITPTGGVAGSYTLINTNSSPEPFVVTPSVTTSYTVSGTGTNGCVSLPGNELITLITVSSSPTISLVSVTPSQTLCAGQSATISVSGAAAGSYTLINNPSATEPFVVSPSASTIYTISGSSANGCVNLASNELTITISVSSNLSVSTIVQTITCNGGNNGSITASVSTTNAYTYLWSNGLTTGSINNLTAGSYSLTITDVSNCKAMTSAILIEPNAISVTELVNNPSCDNASTGNVSLNIMGGTPTYSVIWSNGNVGTSVSQVPSGVITATITDFNGCMSLYNTTINEEMCIETLIPELISPNGDGKNEPFMINSISYYPNNKLEIFNRWGSLVYTKEKYDNTFNGKANVNNSSGNGLLPAGTYFVVFDFGDGKTEPYHGFLEINY